MGLFGKKSDHPLADLRSAQILLDELPKSDTHKLLMEMADMMASVTENADFKLDYQYALLSLIDETAQPYVRKLTEEYFSPGELNSFQEGRLWLVLGNFSRQTAVSYFAVFDRHIKTEKPGSTIKVKVPLLMARTVYAMIWQLKYACAHYELVEYAIWTNLAHIYSYAEQQQCLDTQVNLYPGSVGGTTVKCEVGHLLAWYASGVSSLSPVHMHLTERIIAQYCLGLDVHIQQHDASKFSFNLHDPDAPIRAKMNAALSPSTRFVSVLAMQPKLEHLMRTLNKNIVPDDLFLGGSYGVELIKEAVRHLLAYFKGPPLRRSVRRAIKINFNVESSFAQVVKHVHACLGFSKERPMLTMDDISANGFLTVVPAQDNAGIRIGSVLGMHLEGVPHWGGSRWLGGYFAPS